MLQVIDERSPDGAIRLRPLRRAVFERMCQCGDVDAAELELVCGAVIDRRDDDPERARAVAPLAEYWQVDLDAAVIEAWRGRDARFGTWATVTRYSRGEVACHATRPALALSIDELLARPRGAQRLRWRPGAATPSP